MLTFTYGGCRVAVRTSEAADLSWLAEFLSPWFAVGPGGDADVTLTLRSLCAADWTDIQARMETDRPATVASFVLDSGVVRQPAWREGDGTWTVVDAELDALYRVAPGARTVEVAAAGREQTRRVALMRVVRELATVAATRSGRLLLHAAALARDGRTVLLVGPKRAGKTTLLLRALAGPGLTFVANDRVVVWTADAPIARGMPSIIWVRPEVLGALAPLASRLRDVGYHHAVTMREARTGGAWRRKDGAADLTPAQLCDLLGVEATAQARVSAVVFPSASVDAGRARLEPLSAQAALPRLLEGLFAGGVTPDGGLFDGLGDASRAPAPSAERRCQLLLAQAPAFTCRFDPSRLEAHDAAAIVDEALRPR